MIKKNRNYDPKISGPWQDYVDPENEDIDEEEPYPNPEDEEEDDDYYI